MLKTTEKLVEKARLPYVSPSSCSFLSLNPFVTAQRVLRLCFTLLVDFRLACISRHISAFRHVSAVKKPCSILNFVNTAPIDKIRKLFCKCKQTSKYRFLLKTIWLTVKLQFSPWNQDINQFQQSQINLLN